MINKSVEEHTNSLAAYMPSGRLFEAKSVQDSNFRQLLRGFSHELFNAQGYLVTLNNEYLPNETNLFLSEWESALGIPDSCFTGVGTNDQRRRDILVKLASLGVQTADDFVRLASIFGKTVTVEPLSDQALPPYNIPLIPADITTARFTIIVSGVDLILGVPPFDIPHFLDRQSSILVCLFGNQIAANCNVIFKNTN